MDQKIFVVTKNQDNNAGDYWWFVNPSEHIKYPNRPLNDRLEETVLSILRRKIAVKFDDVLGELFQTYPNGLLPHQKSVKSVLEKYAYQSAGKWKLKDEVLQSINQHNEIIRKLSVIGKAVTDNLVYVGKREQPELTVEMKRLSDYADLTSLNYLEKAYNPERISRLEMIDLLWLSKSQPLISCVFEVENTTGFTSAIQRGSNAEATIPKIMIIPNDREVELKKIQDPLFLSAFVTNGWHYITYDDVERLYRFSQPSLQSLLTYAKNLTDSSSGE